MVSFLEAVGNGIRNAYCQMLSTAPAFWEQYVPTIGGLPNPGIGAARFAQRLFCNNEPPDLPRPPFSGGQCPDISYTVIVTYTGFLLNGEPDPNTTGNPQQFSSFGPIGGARVDQDATAFFVVGLGQPSVAAPSGEYPLGTLNKSAYSRVQIDNIQVVPPPGVPDVCGDPSRPVPNPPDEYNTFNFPITYNDNSNNPITIPVNLVFAPVAIGNNNTIQIPFNLNVPIDFNLNLNGTLNIPGGDINFNFGNGRGVSGSDDCPPPASDIDDDIPPVPDDVPDDVPPVNPDEIPQVIRGAIVTTSLIGDNTSVYFQDDVPDLYLPRLGNVQFLVEIDGKLAWTDTIDVRNRRQLVLCPWEGGAVRVDGFPRPGITWTITPVYDLSSLPIPVRPYVQP